MDAGADLVKYRMWIGGEWVESVSGEYFPSDNPFLGKPWALIPKRDPRAPVRGKSGEKYCANLKLVGCFPRHSRPVCLC